MTPTRRAVVAGGLGSLLGRSAVDAQEAYPTKPITMVMTFAAGGGGDIVARINARYMSTELGQPVTVVNRPGGNSIPGVVSMISAPADGYTILFDGSATSSLQALIPDLPYPVQNRAWGPMTSDGPYFLAVNARSAYRTLAEFVTAAKANPDAIRIAWLGGASFTDTVMTYFLRVAGIDFARVRKVPFNGSGPGATALAGGHIDFASGAVPAVMPFYTSGDARVLALTGENRHPAMPDVPTAREAGFHVPLTGWTSISAPAGTPPAAMARIEAVVQKMVADPAYAADLARVGSVPRFLPGARMWPMIEEEIKVLRELRQATR